MVPCLTERQQTAFLSDLIDFLTKACIPHALACTIYALSMLDPYIFHGSDLINRSMALAIINICMVLSDNT